MKKLGYILLAAALCLTAAGCSGGEASSAPLSSPAASSAVSAPVSSSAPSSDAKLQTGPGPQVVEIQGFMQENSGAEAGYEPTIRLMENGSFEFSVFLYDGISLVSGSYEDIEGEYVLTCTQSSSTGMAASDLGEIRLEKTDTGVIYHGVQAGVTGDGAVFIKQ